MQTLFRAFAELGEKVEGTRKRLVMIDLVAEFLKSLETEEVEPAVSMMLGRPFSKQSELILEVSWATVSRVIQSVTGVDWAVFDDAFSKTGDMGSATMIVFENSRRKRQSTLFRRTLTLTEVRRSLEVIAEVGGPASTVKKRRLLSALLSELSPVEAKYLVRILIGGMRTGFHEGLMEQAVSKAFQVPLMHVQEASMIIGDIGDVAAILKKCGVEGLSKVDFRVFRPVSLMLAQVVDTVAEALEEHGGRTAFEFKYDGARVQIHKRGDQVRIFSRRLTDVTGSLPEIAQAAKTNIRSKEAILEGEVVAIGALGRPVPFQYLMRRFRRVHDVEGQSVKVPVRLFLFDILYLDGKRLISNSYLERRRILAENAGEICLSSQLVTESAAEAERFLKESLAAGHEGLMAKRLDSPYMPGMRGKHWLKIKPVLEPLDLVIVAAEYGYGRRHEWLSDYYLAARDAETGEYVTVGKTFKGLTDAEFKEITRRLKGLIVNERSRRVSVVPVVVVEVAYNEIQTSPKYACGMTLRFARIVQIRDDKTPEEADTIQKVREIYERQRRTKGSKGE
jgi:DNA ligase-1